VFETWKYLLVVETIDIDGGSGGVAARRVTGKVIGNRTSEICWTVDGGIPDECGGSL
jgi:hypothetical protein